MKVFGCYNRISKEGMIIACGNTLEEAYNAFSYSKTLSKYNSPVFSKNGDYIGNMSIYYPQEKWFEMSELKADCNEAKVLYESTIKLCL